MLNLLSSIQATIVPIQTKSDTKHFSVNDIWIYSIKIVNIPFPREDNSNKVKIKLVKYSSWETVAESQSYL